MLSTTWPDKDIDMQKGMAIIQKHQDASPTGTLKFFEHLSMEGDSIHAINPAWINEIIAYFIDKYGEDNHYPFFRKFMHEMRKRMVQE